MASGKSARADESTEGAVVVVWTETAYTSEAELMTHAKNIAIRIWEGETTRMAKGKEWRKGSKPRNKNEVRPSHIKGFCHLRKCIAKIGGLAEGRLRAAEASSSFRRQVHTTHETIVHVDRVGFFL